MFKSARPNFAPALVAFTVLAFVAVAFFFLNRGMRTPADTGTGSTLSDDGSATVLPETVPARFAFGALNALSDTSLTIAIDRNLPGSQDLPESVTVTIVPGTRVIRYVSAEDTDTYRAAMDAYRENVTADPSYHGMPPAPYAPETLSVSDLRDGQAVSIGTDVDFVLVSDPVAVEIVIRSEPAENPSVAPESSDVSSAGTQERDNPSGDMGQ